jgi:hypothetical protein
MYGEMCCRRWGGDSCLAPPAEMLPWSDIVGCCVQYRLLGLGQAGERLICYREETLLNYLPPLQWTR